MDPIRSNAVPQKLEVASQSDTSPAKPLPYRWGYFQGAFLIPFSLVTLFSVAADQIKPRHDPWYLAIIRFLMGAAGFPLAIGLRWKKRFGLILAYAIFGLTLLLVAVRLPIAIRHYTDPGDTGSAFFEAELLLLWLLSLVYYRKRRAQFR